MYNLHILRLLRQKTAGNRVTVGPVDRLTSGLCIFAFQKFQTGRRGKVPHLKVTAGETFHRQP